MRCIAASSVALALVAGCAAGDAPTQTAGDAALLAYDADAPLDASAALVTTDPVPTERVEFTTFDDTRVPGTFVVDPEAGTSAGPCLIIQHGSGGTRAEGVALAGALRFGGVHVNVLAIDARLHGERAPNGETTAPNDVATWAEVVVDTAKDLRRAIDYLETRAECDADRIGLFGISMGGFLGTLTAAVDQRIHAVVLLATGADYGLLLTQSPGFFPEVDRDDPASVEDALAVLDPIDPERFVGAIAPRPLMMINGEADQLIPIPVARQLHEWAGVGSEIEWFPGGHVPNQYDSLTYADDLVHFLNDELIGA